MIKYQEKLRVFVVVIFKLQSILNKVIDEKRMLCMGCIQPVGQGVVYSHFSAKWLCRYGYVEKL